MFLLVKNLFSVYFMMLLFCFVIRREYFSRIFACSFFVNVLNNGNFNVFVFFVYVFSYVYVCIVVVLFFFVFFYFLCLFVNEIVACVAFDR